MNPSTHISIADTGRSMPNAANVLGWTIPKKPISLLPVVILAHLPGKKDECSTAVMQYVVGPIGTPGDARLYLLRSMMRSTTPCVNSNPEVDPEYTEARRRSLLAPTSAEASRCTTSEHSNSWKGGDNALLAFNVLSSPGINDTRTSSKSDDAGFPTTTAVFISSSKPMCSNCSKCEHNPKVRTSV